MDNASSFNSQFDLSNLNLRNWTVDLAKNKNKFLENGFKPYKKVKFQGKSARYEDIKIKEERFLNSTNSWFSSHESQSDSIKVFLSEKRKNQIKEKDSSSCPSLVTKSFFSVISNLYLTKKFINILKGQNSKLTPKFLTKKHFNIINDLSFFYDIWKKKFDNKKLFKDNNGNNITKNYSIFSRASFKRLINCFKKLKVFDNSMSFIIFWNVINAFIIIIFFLIIPFELCFEMKLSKEYEYFNSIYYISFCIFLLDFFITCNTTIYMKGKFIKNRLEIVHEYFKRKFFFDFICQILLALEIYDDVTNTDPLGKGSLFLKLTQLLFFCKIVKFSSILQKLEEMLFIDESMYNKLSLLKLILRIIFISHIFACVWYYVGTLDSENSWILHNSLEFSPWYVKYLNSYYFVCITMNTVGYGDITPQNPWEKFFSIIFTYMACGMFAYSLNSIGVIVAEIAKREKEFQRELNVINGFMKKKNINADLKIRVKKYLEYIWYEEKIEKIDEEEKIIQKLSDSMKEELLLEANGSILRNLKMFSFNFSEDFLRSMIPCLQEVRYSPEDVIYMKGDHENLDLYIILNGSVELYYETSKPHDQSNVLKILTKGETFGEISFFSEQEREVCAKSVECTTVYRIKRNDFLSLVIKFDADFQKFCEIKDSINNSKDPNFLYIKCFSCSECSHLIHQCPLLTPKVLKNLVLTKYLHPLPQVRNGCFRRGRVKSNFFQSNKNVVSKVFHLRKSLEIDESENYEENQNENKPFESLENLGNVSTDDLKGLQRIKSLERHQKHLSVFYKEKEEDSSNKRRNFLREDSPSIIISQNSELVENIDNKYGVPSSYNNFSFRISNQNLEEPSSPNKKIKTLLNIVDDLKNGTKRESVSQRPDIKKQQNFFPNDDLDLVKSWDIYFPNNNLEEVLAGLNKFKRKHSFGLPFFKNFNKNTKVLISMRRKSTTKKRFFQDPIVMEKMLKECQFDEQKFRQNHKTHYLKRNWISWIKKWLRIA